MTKNIATLLTVVALSFPFWVGVDALQQKIEDHIYEKNLALNHPMALKEHTLSGAEGTALSAQVTNHVGGAVEPFEYPDYPELSEYQIGAQSAIVAKIDMEGGVKTIFQQNLNDRLPIASLTKLMTALVASEFYRETEQIGISQKAVAQLERTGYLKPGEILSPEELLYIMLIESSNDAAYAISELVGGNGFIGLMNLKAKDFGMNDTYFYNPHGLDPEDTGLPEEEINYSTVSDLTNMAKHLLKEYPQILEISSKEKYDLYLQNGSFHHTLYNTDELVYELNDIADDRVVGSKTGLTDRAGGCLFLVLKGSTPDTYYVNILLNSPDRFLDMRKLITYIPE